MNLLLDTHVLLWLANDPKRLTDETIRLTEEASDLWFSVASIWEVVLKNSLGREDFQIVPRRFYEGLLLNGYSELIVNSYHALAVGLLPNIHNDPIDRLLVAQAQVEDTTLLTMDKMVSRYPGPIRYVQ